MKSGGDYALCTEQSGYELIGHKPIITFSTNYLAIVGGSQIVVSDYPLD